ncbi:hypothetical protein D3C87_1758270 [compost metagenome]
MLPLLVPWSSSSVSIDTVTPELSTTMFRGAPCPLLLPAGSTTSVVSACGPFASGAFGVKLQSPLPSTGALPSSVPLS